MPGSPEYFFFSLPDFKKAEGELLSVRENWIYLLQHSKTFSEIPCRYRGDPTFSAYFEASNRASFSKAEENQYTRDMMTQRDIENSKREACEKAKAEGLATGLKEGLKEGRQEEKLKVARKMKADGVEVGKIAKYSGLSLSELEKL